MDWKDKSAVVVERCRGLAAELQLQRRGEEFEIIYNGVFLMATYNGASERRAVRDALTVVTAAADRPVQVLIGGLGMGYSLREALDCDQVMQVDVAEIEPAVIRWNRGTLRKFNENALSDPRVNLINSDFRMVLERKSKTALRLPSNSYDLVLVDTDNGSSWLSLPSNAFFYSAEGLKLIAACLKPLGAAAFWCAREEKTLAARLAEHFEGVAFHRVCELTGQEGCYYLAAVPRKRDPGSA